MQSAGVKKERFPEIVEQPVFYGSREKRQAAGRYKAIIDTGTGKLFSIVSQGYRPIRHEDAIDRIESAIDRTPDLGQYGTETSFYNDGGRMRRVYRFTDRWVEIQQGDCVNPELQLYNSYDAKWPFIVILGAYRIICSNGLVIGRDFLRMKKRHVYDLDTLGLEEEVSTALKRFDLQGGQWKEWAGRALKPGTAERIMEKMELGDRAAGEVQNRIIQEAAGCDDTGFPIISLWAFFNVITWYITHRAVSLNHRVAMEGRLRRAVRGLK